MKYMKTDLIKKSILILLSLAFMLSLFACKNENDESSLPEEISQTNEFGLDTAKSLIERDRQITDMFVNNSLCSKKVTEYSPVISQRPPALSKSPADQMIISGGFMPVSRKDVIAEGDTDWAFMYIPLRDLSNSVEHVLIHCRGFVFMSF